MKMPNHYCDILIVFHCVTAGQNSSELLGSDESDLVTIVWQLIDLHRNKVSCFVLRFVIYLFSFIYSNYCYAVRP